MSANNKFICIHGHFYQPPRENAWLEVIELQDSAAPFHDWNERINFECYALNTAARILDEEHRIIKIVNNYTKISFNFGPTLLSWMEHFDPETYQAILEADRISQEQFNGHGSALAQVHSHLILPLASRRDKETQVKWGIADFVHRFGRHPEGMWLSETAANTETLEVLAENNIKFTILAPRQAKAIRKIGTEDWQELPSEQIDTRRPYLYRLPSGKSIALFFYHGGIAQGVAFEGLLNNGKAFAQRFYEAFDHSEEPQLAHIATDGESYGHHHRHGEMALADCLSYIEERNTANLTNYADFLEQFPPVYEVKIHENSSWSCVHGVERWQSNCGCNSGGHSGWTQEWRVGLRETLDWLRDKLIPIYEKEASKILKDIWAARDDYIQILLQRNQKSIEAFISTHAKKTIKDSEKTHLLRLMELQRHAMLMYTSCGWFFDEISGIETNQILQYANRAIYYASQVGKVHLHDKFVKRLEKAPSNVFANGAESYKLNVVPARVDLTRVGMHYAASSLFEEYPEHLELFNYIAESEVFDRFEAGTQKLALGRTKVRSKITHSEKHFSFAVLYLGQQNIIGNISIDMNRNSYDEMAEKVLQAFKTPDLGQVIGIMQSYFGSEKYSLWHLFRDEKRKILQQISAASLKQVENAYRDIYNDNYQLMSDMVKSEMPVPDAYKNAVQFVVNHDLRLFFENGRLSIRELERLNSEFKKWDIQLTNASSLGLAASERVFQEIKKLNESEASISDIQNLNMILSTIEELGLKPNAWKSQNLYVSMLNGYLEGTWVFSSKEWEDAFYKLGDLLEVRILKK